jgi:hypothetical protein
MNLAILALITCTPGWPQDRLTSAAAVLEKYQKALGGVDAIRNVQSETRRGEFEASGREGKATFVAYARPFKSLQVVTWPDGRKVTSGFDGRVSWTVTAQGASIDKATPLEALRRDADLQYPLHQPDYFRNLELAGVVDFEARQCYWLHGTTRWGKDNNQFYDVQTGLLAGYRFQSDTSSAAGTTTMVFQDHKSFGGPLVATKVVSRSGDRIQTITFTSVSYAPLADSVFELPKAVQVVLDGAK